MTKRFIISILSINIILLSACEKKQPDIMNATIKASDFQELKQQINLVCAQVNPTICSYIKGYITYYLPKASGDAPFTTQEVEKSEEIFNKMNNKTPTEMIEMYKDVLRSSIEEDMKRDEYVSRNLDNIKKTYDKTHKFAKDIIVSNINASIGQDDIITLSFTIENQTNFDLLQFSGEVEFFTAGDTFLARSKAFNKKVEPFIPSKNSVSVNIVINSIPKEDIVLVRAAKDLTTKVIITSIQTNSQDNETSALILSLPYSYHHLRDMIKDREKLYNAYMKKIDNLYTNK